MKLIHLTFFKETGMSDMYITTNVYHYFKKFEAYFEVLDIVEDKLKELGEMWFLGNIEIVTSEVGIYGWK